MANADLSELITQMPRAVTVHDSSAITHLGYDPTRKCLRVRFRQTATIWEYAHVWPSEFAQLVSAYSLGAAFNERIRNRKDAQRLDPPPSVGRAAGAQ